MRTIIRATLLVMLITIGIVGAAFALTGETRGIPAIVTASDISPTADGFTWGTSGPPVGI